MAATQTTEKLRLDKYLWAIRVFKTRTQASTACEAGKVKMNGSAVKAARTVSVGDQYEIKNEARRWKIEVTGLLHTRQQYTEAIKYYVDITTEEDQLYNQRVAATFYTGKRISKIGRPTKRERRDLDGFMEGEKEEE
ncbi:RNA-binding S4 domain-containing protein [Chitinophaga agrisoli]|uniref:RNA-binding S4 domain-containing protein n=1 Tax=Chitinophaga agrisoli TaxID=2607653 RepID=A0A5B2W317_9BACT|nr:RNA-binding S4 domain-containing protein [Chitinophaga agrisoli]KAA2245775.1 RNA-binding S4 domain-containing protein [Chitinophaga agrisoli]